MAHKYANPDCPQCHGVGAIYIINKEKKSIDEPDDFYQMCPCTIKQMILDKLSHISSEIVKAKISDSEKFVGRHKDNLKLIGVFGKILPHIKRALIEVYLKENMNFSCQLVTDRQVRELWFHAGENRKKRYAAEFADFEADEQFLEVMEVPFTQSLSSSDLLILVTGHISYKNVADPGIMLEAIKSRQIYGKPTWIYLPHQLTPSDYVYSEEMTRILSDYKQFVFGSKDERIQLVGGVSTPSSTVRGGSVLPSGSTFGTMTQVGINDLGLDDEDASK